MRVFKFMPSKFAEGFLKTGTIKIGTAEEYRESDGATGARSDEYEMTTVLSPGDAILKLSEIPLLWKRYPKADPNATFVFGEGTGLQFQYTAYLYCTSCSLSRVLVKRMKHEFKADACVAIMDFNAFAHAVSRSCSELCSTDFAPVGNYEFWIDKVKYRPKRTDGKYADHFEKRPEFRWQNEARIIWPANSLIKPLIVDVPTVVPMLKRVDLSSFS